MDSLPLSMAFISPFTPLKPEAPPTSTSNSSLLVICLFVMTNASFAPLKGGREEGGRGRRGKEGGKERGGSEGERERETEGGREREGERKEGG